ncbi:hypothetical protein [Specibacter sp. NPDC078692]|uniref:hypothetical protein n=1 Tax=Specibacter sp. NPDC078692 TaxID=3155818 RepID=UPI003438150A
MNTLIQKFLALFSAPKPLPAEASETRIALSGMPLASPEYLREFAHRIGLEVDDLSPAEQTELKARLDRSMDFREENYAFLYHEVYQLGHGYSLEDASRVSAQINKISSESAARAFLDYRENAVAAEALMAAGSLLKEEGDTAAAERLFMLANARRHRSSLLEVNLADTSATDSPEEPAEVVEAPKTAALAIVDNTSDDEAHGTATDATDGEEQATETENSGLEGLMHAPVTEKKSAK